MLDQIDGRESSEYSRLKERFRQHRILLQADQDLSNEQIQLAVDSVLTDENLETRMAEILGRAVPRPPSRGFVRTTLSRWRSGVGIEQPQKSSTKRSHLEFVADSNFLAELLAISIDQPVYKETVEKIIESASQRLSNRLRRFLEESLTTANGELVKLLQQEVQRKFASSRGEARSRAEAELRNQVQSALASEHDIPGNRYVNLRSGHFISALRPWIDFVSISAVLLQKVDGALVSLRVMSNGID